MDTFLQECRANFGARPRNFGFWDRLTYLRVGRPRWLRSRPTDELAVHFDHLDSVLSEGMVVWGHVVQANRLMFASGNANCPGELVYSIDDPRRVEPADLQVIAHALFKLKGTKPRDPELLPIADYLTDEMIRVFGLSVPTSISQHLRCKISTTFFVRKHLPMRRLCAPLLPIIVNPRKPHVAMPLPERYWPEELVAWWTQNFSA